MILSEIGELYLNEGNTVIDLPLRQIKLEGFDPKKFCSNENEVKQLLKKGVSITLYFNNGNLFGITKRKPGEEIAEFPKEIFVISLEKWLNFEEVVRNLIP